MRHALQKHVLHLWIRCSDSSCHVARSHLWCTKWWRCCCQAQSAGESVEVNAIHPVHTSFLLTHTHKGHSPGPTGVTRSRHTCKRGHYSRPAWLFERACQHCTTQILMTHEPGSQWGAATDGNRHPMLGCTTTSSCDLRCAPMNGGSLCIVAVPTYLTSPDQVTSGGL